jgi:hypothetical protein
MGPQLRDAAMKDVQTMQRMEEYVSGMVQRGRSVIPIDLPKEM